MPKPGPAGDQASASISLGHVNSTVTKTVYRHQIADEITSAATAMEAIFGEASSS
jgi:hypothetical protein